jgi:UDP-N-acetylglucosamine 1-carboxyvinyltransferase
MDKFIIKGGRKLSGSVKVSGSKNSSLALMPASILASGKSFLKNTPELNDVYTMSKLLKHLGAEINFKNEILEIDSSGINDFTAPYEHVKKMRASVYVLGPLAGKIRKSKSIIARWLCLGSSSGKSSSRSNEKIRCRY